MNRDDYLLSINVNSLNREGKLSIKTRNSMGQDRLNAFAVLTIHSDIITKDKDFHTKVIDKFASIKEHRLNFIFK